MAPRRLALWAIYTLSKAQHYDDTRDGLWHVCSPAWAVPQLDDDSLTADEAWRVEKYLARAACSSQTPIICQICAGLAARADGASNAPGTCGLKKGEQPFDSLLLQTTGQVAACTQATDGKLHAYYSELSCLLEAYSRATPLVVLPPSLRWGFRFGDTTRAMEGAYLTKARKVGTRDQAVLLPLHTGRHAGGLRLLQQTVEHTLPTFYHVWKSNSRRWRGASEL